MVLWVMVVVLVLMLVVGNVGGKEVLCCQWSGCTLLAQVLGGDQEQDRRLR